MLLKAAKQIRQLINSSEEKAPIQITAQVKRVRTRVKDLIGTTGMLIRKVREAGIDPLSYTYQDLSSGKKILTPEYLEMRLQQIRKPIGAVYGTAEDGVWFLALRTVPGSYTVFTERRGMMTPLFTDAPIDQFVRRIERGYYELYFFEAKKEFDDAAGIEVDELPEDMDQEITPEEVDFIQV